MRRTTGVTAYKQDTKGKLKMKKLIVFAFLLSGGGIWSTSALASIQNKILCASADGDSMTFEKLSSNSAGWCNTGSGQFALLNHNHQTLRAYARWDDCSKSGLHAFAKTNQYIFSYLEIAGTGLNSDAYFINQNGQKLIFKCN
jgi:hypothetical protein